MIVVAGGNDTMGCMFTKLGVLLFLLSVVLAHFVHHLTRRTLTDSFLLRTSNSNVDKMAKIEQSMVARYLSKQILCLALESEQRSLLQLYKTSRLCEVMLEQ